MPPEVKPETKIKYESNIQSTYNEPIAHAPQHPEPVHNVVPYETVQTLVNESANRAATEATNRVLANMKAESESAKFQISNVDDDINLDREMRRTFYKKMTKPSFGDVLSDQIDSNLASSLVEKLIPNLFGGGTTAAVTKKEGFVGMISDFLNTQFAYGAGQALGNRAPEIINALGKDKIGGIIDAYQQKLNPGSSSEPQQPQEQLSPAEQQKKTETVIMGLDTTIVEHVTNFMQATGIKDYNAAQKEILSQQNRILESRGLVREKQISHEEVRKSEPEKFNNPKNDINRQLMEQYENGGHENGGSTNTGGNSFFNEGIKNELFESNNWDDKNNTGSGNERNESEFIMSLNPDDPISQQQYIAVRKISGVPIDIVKKMMIKEQKSLANGVESVPIPESPIKSSSVNDILSILEKMDKNFDSNLKIVTDKMLVLENEILVLKSSRKEIIEDEDVNLEVDRNDDSSKEKDIPTESEEIDISIENTKNNTEETNIEIDNDTERKKARFKVKR